MTSEANTGQGVAAVVARVEDDVPRRAQWVVQHTVDALDAAGLLLTAARRALVEATVDHEAALTDIRIKTNATPEETTVQAVLRVMFERDMAVPALARLRAEQAALLRELAGDGGAPASEPVCSGCGAWAKDCFCTPTPAPRRMAAMPERGIHSEEHDERAVCAAWDPPCQPVAAAHDPRDFDPGAGAPIGVLPADVVAARKHMERTRHVSVGEYAAPTHEHRWGKLASQWVATQEKPSGYASMVTVWRERVTREHCTRGDCRETREVSHG